MQEEVEQRVVTLIVNCTKLTEQELRKALAKLLEQMKSQKQTKLEEAHSSQYSVFLHRPVCHQAGSGDSTGSRYGSVREDHALHGRHGTGLRILFAELPPGRSLCRYRRSSGHTAYRLHKGQERKEVPKGHGIRLRTVGRVRGHQALH